MGKYFKKYLNSESIKRCKKCYTHITKSKYIISKKYRGDYGTGFLTIKLTNIRKEEGESITMNSGKYVISKCNCISCGNYLGWKYLQSKNKKQKFKVGKYILEKKLII